MSRVIGKLAPQNCASSFFWNSSKEPAGACWCQKQTWNMAAAANQPVLPQCALSTRRNLPMAAAANGLRSGCGTLWTSGVADTMVDLEIHLCTTKICYMDFEILV